MESEAESKENVLLGTSRVSETGQITLTKKVRETMGIEADNIIAFYLKGNELFLRKIVIE